MPRIYGGYLESFPHNAIYSLVGETTIALTVAATLTFSSPSSWGVDGKTYTPIARSDVPQDVLVDTGETLNFGLVAFSKNQIANASFAISGAGYIGTTPKVATSMTYNSQSGIYEYWVPISASDFTSDGTATVTTTVTGVDGGQRTMIARRIRVNPNGTLGVQAWVDAVGGSDTSGQVGVQGSPYKTISAAALDIQAQEGNCDEAFLNLAEGTYDIGEGAITTPNGYLTVRAQAGATKANVIINSSGSITDGIKFKTDGVRLVSQAHNQFVLYPGSNSPAYLWTNDTDYIGSGRDGDGSGVVGSSPVRWSNSENVAATNCYLYDLDRGFGVVDIVRGTDAYYIGEDFAQNSGFIANCTARYIYNSMGWHADARQMHTDGYNPGNEIVYGYRATDLHYQGLFCRATLASVAGFAVVNCLFEIRSPALSGGGFSGVYGDFSHWLMWHNTFVGPYNFAYGSDTSGYPMTDSSFIGNIFYAYTDGPAGNPGSEPTYSVNGNAQNNVFLYNAYRVSYTLGDAVVTTSRAPDSGATTTRYHGDPQIEDTQPAMGVDVSATFGMPDSGSPMIGMVPRLVPCDMYQQPRAANSCCGAVERLAA